MTKKDLYASNLRCEYLVNPLSIDETHPRLSWILMSDELNQVQTAYQILAASSPENLEKDKGDLWDTGEVESDRSNQIVYEGKPLKSGQRCYWKARVWDKNGNVTPYSEPAFWGAGLLDKTDWKGRWIGIKNTNPDTAGPSPFIRKEFNTKGKIESAVLYATARGIYEAYINGKRVGEDIFAPGWTDYKKRIQYQTYDVTEMLQTGDNCIGAVLGDGWYSGHMAWNVIRNRYGKQTSFLCQLVIEYENGESEMIVSDKTWKGSTGPVLSSDMLMGEVYNAVKELPGWNKPGFDDSGWKEADVFRRPSAVLVAQPTQTIRITEYINAQKITEPEPGVYIVDLGQNFAGFVQLKVKGKKGTKVTLRHAEVLNPDGTIYTTNLRAAKATDTYILKGEGEEIYRPFFTFHGFRYVEVTGYPGKPSLDAITGCAVNSDLPVTGTFECSDPMINRLAKNILWSQRANYISIPTDCPQRDERLGWTGDAQIFIRTGAFNMDVAAFFKKWMQDVEDSQSPEGAFKDTCPYVNGLGTDGAPGWGDAGIIIPWYIYRCYGDRKIIEKHYEAMQKWMEYLYEENLDFIRRNRLNNNYGDWVSVNSETPKEVLATAYWAYDAKLMSKMAGVIGKNEDAEKYEKLYMDIKGAYIREFVSETGQVHGNTQTAYLLSLFADLIPENLKEKAIEHLVIDLKEKDYHLSTGFLGARHLNPVLTDVGHADIAYRLLNNKTYPSWGYAIGHGATSIWERWDGWTEEKGFQDPGMNSFNHYAFGSVGEWLFRYAAGIDLDPDIPAYKHMIIRPYPGGGLKYVKAEYNSIYGKIFSHWRLDGETLKYDVTIPVNTTATVYVPTTGKVKVVIPGVKFVGDGTGYAIFELGSGEYSFESEWRK
ncbi:family 78 glycoside hydrolase catalytic domain [candidate division KSB1 bacterium]